METKPRVFGGPDDKRFWSDKPVVYGHPDFKTKWYHIHIYNKPYHPIHKSPDGQIMDEMHNVVFYKCRCGKPKVTVTDKTPLKE